MDSINQQQPEENLKDLQGEQAGKKIKELAEKADACFFCSGIINGRHISTRPMAVQKVDEHGNFWFLSSSDSKKNFDIMKDDKVQLMFQGSAHAGFLSIYGSATISRDKNMIKELWEPIFKTWFTHGEDDPRITVIKVETVEGYYWDNKHGKAVAFVKMAAGALMGKTLDDSIQGHLNV